MLWANVPFVLLLLAASGPGLLLRDAEAVRVHIFTNVTAPDFTYPEINFESPFYISNIQGKPSLGIAISGGNGGWRAAALGYGWLRALHLVSVLSKSLSHHLKCIQTCHGDASRQQTTAQPHKS